MAGKDSIPVLAKVKKRKRDANNLPVGDANLNLILETSIYELEFPDGRIEERHVNAITEKFLYMADVDGWDPGLLE